MNEPWDKPERDDRTPEPDETEYLMSTPAMRKRLLESYERAKNSQIPIDEVNRTQIPVELRSATGGRAWLVPENLWHKLREVAQSVSADTKVDDE